MPFVCGMPGIEGHQGVDAKHQTRPGLEGDGRMQRLFQRAIDIPATIDLDRRVQARQGSTGLDRGGDRHMLEALRAEGDRSSRIEVRRDQVQRLPDPAKIVAQAGQGEQPAQEMVDPGVVEHPGRNCP
jgi:hypothetical protein